MQKFSLIAIAVRHRPLKCRKKTRIEQVVIDHEQTVLIKDTLTASLEAIFNP